MFFRLDGSVLSEHLYSFYTVQCLSDVTASWIVPPHWWQSTTELWLSQEFVCLFISKNDADRITKLDTQMFYNESRIVIYFAVRGLGHESKKQCRALSVFHTMFLLSVYPYNVSKTDAVWITNRHVPRWILDTCLFWGQRHCQGHEAQKTVCIGLRMGCNVACCWVHKLCWVFPNAMPHYTSHASDIGFSLHHFLVAGAAANCWFPCRVSKWQKHCRRGSCHSCECCLLLIFITLLMLL